MKRGRNKPCPCGSGRKTKHCCGSRDSAIAPTPAAVDALRRALAFHQAGRLAPAEALYQQVLASQPRNSDALHMLGVLAGQQGNLSRAVALIRQALDIRPRFAEAHNNLGSFLQAQESHREAVICYRMALEIRPGYPEALNNLGNALRQDKDALPEAKDCYQRAIELRPDYPEAHLNLGLVYYTEGRLTDAAERYRHALGKNPKLAEAHHSLGLALQSLGLFDESLDAYRNALSLQPRHGETHNNLGNLFRAMGQRDQAIASYRRALELRPDYIQAHCNLALVLDELEHPDEALEHYRKALALNPQHREARYGIARIMHERGNFESAALAYRYLIEQHPDFIEPYAALMRCKRITGQDMALIERMTAMLSDTALDERDAASLHFALGKAWNDLEDYDRAMSHYVQGNRFQAAQCPFDRAAHETRITGLIDDWERSAAVSGQTSELPVLIVGMPRSGTTLLEQMLSRHPDIAAGGEIDFWAVRETAPEIQSEPAAATDYLARLQRLAPGASRVTDKLTTNFLRLGFIHQLLPRARIIHCRRHPLDTCLSVYFTHFRGAHCYSYDLEDLAFYYEQYRRLMAHWRSVLPADRFCEVDYEELIGAPEATLRALVAFCDVAWDPACLDRKTGERSVRTASKWQVRQPLYKSSIGRWRHYAPHLGPLRYLDL